MRDTLSRLRLATVRALESAAAFVAGSEAVAAHKAARAETFAAWTQLPHTTRDALALRAALGCLVMVARGKESAVGESDTELRDLGMEIPLRELAGRIEASRRVNPTRRRVTREYIRAEANKKLYRSACARADDAQRRETLALLALRDLVRACERCPEMRYGDAGQERCVKAAHDAGGHLFASDQRVAPDDDEPAVGDEPTLVSQ